jgi:RNA polymerase sigma factor (sigma-70 family)
MSIVHPLGLESPAIYVCAQAGCAACLDALLRRHEGLVHVILRRQWRGDMAYVDLLQEGRIGLWRAILGFDPHRGVAFSSYAGRAIERRMWRAVALAVRREAAEEAVGENTLPRPLDVLEMAEEALWWAQVCAALADLLFYLPDRLQEVIIAAYGLDGAPPRSLAALGRHYGVSRESVRLWRNEALVQLRLPPFSLRLRELCEQNSRAAYARTLALNRAWLSRRRKRGRP